MHKLQAVLALAFLPCLAAQDPGTTYHVRVDQALSAAQHRLLHERYGEDCGGGPAGAVELYLHPEAYAELSRLGIRTRVLGRGRPDADIARENAATQLLPDTSYFTVAETEAELDRLAKAYPGLALRVDITALTKTAKTHDGRSIFGLKISDNVASDEDEPALLLAAQHHARELNCPFVVFGAIERILAGYATSSALRDLVDANEIWCVPCVNPDGVERVWTVDNMWRKNGRGTYGVDNNRNYPFLWGLCGSSTTTTSQTYRGPSAGSEPETQTMMALQRLLRPELYLDFHSSGQEVLFPYAPCATVSTTLRAMLGVYADDLRAPMTYATRAPSGSGEAPEWHWADGGTMSFLTEIATSFQPAFASTVTEVARVWPGVERALTTWRPAVRGHVRSIERDLPVAATIRYTPAQYAHGEQAASRARDGRYALWLPLGTWQVTFSAPGFTSVVRTVQVTAYNRTASLEVRMVPVMTAATLDRLGTDRIGTTTQLTYTSPGDAGDTYWVLLSLGTEPGIPIGADRVVPLNPDIAMIASLPPGVLTNSFGVLPASAQATAGFPIPDVPAFIGLKLFAAGLTENKEFLNSIEKFSPAVAITIR